MTALVDTLHIVHLAAMIGWLPLLKLSGSNRAIRQALHQHARGLLFVQLGRCGLLLAPTTPLGLGTLAHLLYTMVLLPMLRQDCKNLRHSWWHGPTVPTVECRVAVRHKVQNPRRRWQNPPSGRGTRRMQRENLRGLFPDNAFADALTTLTRHGDNFLCHRWVHRQADDAGGYLLGLRLEVLTLYCTVAGFEVYLRWSHGRYFDPQDSPSSGSYSDSGSEW